MCYPDVVRAPVVPGTLIHQWCVIDKNTPPDGGERHLAFTSREVFDQWMRATSRTQLIRLVSSFPNPYIIILDEAWAWKYPTPAPTMDTTEAGRRALAALLHGETTETQDHIAPSRYAVGLVIDSASDTPEDILRNTAVLKDRYTIYRALDPTQWRQNGTITPNGELLTTRQTPHQPHIVLTPTGEAAGSVNGKEFAARKGTHYTGPVMVMEFSADLDLRGTPWKPPDIIRRQRPPLYLDFLARS